MALRFAKTYTMRKYVLILTVILFAACGEEADNAGNLKAVKQPKVKERSYCYLRTDGTNNQDTEAIHIIVKNDSVSGEMKYLPHEKDARVGTLTGIKVGDVIKADWLCQQEGMEFTVQVGLKMKRNKVLQQVSAFNDKGEEYLPTNAEYKWEYKEVNCDQFPARNY